MNVNSLIGVVALICAIWVIYDVLTAQKKMSPGSKVLWIVFALIFSIITAIIYYVTVKKK